MVAITGCVLHNADVEFPGYLSLSQQLKFSDIPNGGQGIFNIPAAGVAQILLFCGLVEMAWWPASKYDGDYNVGFFGEKLSPEKKTQKLNAEMANGRLAMLGVAGMVAPELLGGLGIIPEETGLVWYKAGMIPAQGTYDYWASPFTIFWIKQKCRRMSRKRFHPSLETDRSNEQPVVNLYRSLFS